MRRQDSNDKPIHDNYPVPGMEVGDTQSTGQCVECSVCGRMFLPAKHYWRVCTRCFIPATHRTQRWGLRCDDPVDWDPEEDRDMMEALGDSELMI